MYHFQFHEEKRTYTYEKKKRDAPYEVRIPFSFCRAGRAYQVYYTRYAQGHYACLVYMTLCRVYIHISARSCRCKLSFTRVCGCAGYRSRVGIYARVHVIVPVFAGKRKQEVKKGRARIYIYVYYTKARDCKRLTFAAVPRLIAQVSDKITMLTSYKLLDIVNPVLTTSTFFSTCVYVIQVRRKCSLLYAFLSGVYWLRYIQ